MPIDPNTQISIAEKLKEKYGLSVQDRLKTEPELEWWQKPFVWAAEQPVLGPALGVAEKVVNVVDYPWQNWVLPQITAPLTGEDKNWWDITQEVVKANPLSLMRVNPFDVKEQQEYEEWQSPKYVKGALELANPTYLVSGGEVLKGASALAKAGKLGKTASVLGKAGEVVGAAEALPGRVAVFPFKKAAELAKPTKLLADLTPFDDTVKIATMPDNMRKLANLPGLNKITRLVPSATANTPVEKAMVGMAKALSEGSNKTKAVMNELNRLGNSKNVFKLDEAGLLSEGPLTGVHPNDILSNIRKYADDLTPEQLGWAETAQNLNREIAPLLERNGIDINKLKFEDGGEWAGRKVVGKINDEGELLEAAFIGGGAGTKGGKLSLEKTRVFDNIEDAIEEGFRYLSQEETIAFNVQGAYNRIANNQMKDWLLANIPFRTTEVFTLPKANNLINDLLKKTPIRPSKLTGKLNAIERDMPEVARMIKEAMAEPDWPVRFEMLQKTKEYVKRLVPRETDKLFWAVERLQKNKQTLENGVSVLQRMARGEVLPTGTLKALTKVAPELEGKLSETAKRTLDDLIRAGEEAAQYPIALPVPYQKVKKLKAELERISVNLIDKPNDPELLARMKEINRQLGYGKKVIAEAIERGEAYEANILRDVGIKQGRQVKKRIKEIEDMMVSGKRIIKGKEFEKLTANEYKALERELETLQYSAEMIGKAKTEKAIEKGQMYEFTKSARSILLGEKKKDIGEMLKVLRGDPIYTRTATGRPTTKYKGGLIREATEKFNAAKQARTEIRERASRPTFTEAATTRPGFTDVIFTGKDAQDVAKVLNESMNPGLSHALTQVNKVNAVARYFMLAGDMSAATIQLLFLAGAKPKIYGKALKGFVRGMRSPERQAEYIAQNLAILQKHPELILSSGGATEFTEAIAKGGLLQAKGVRHVAKPFEVFGRGFEGALDTAGIEMAKSLDYLATSPLATSQIDAFINEFRGISDLAKIGVSPHNRQLLTAATLAPKYNVAIAALGSDILRGNLRGALARRSMIAGVGAVSAMALATSIALGEDEDQIVEHFDPNSKYFMTWEIGDQMIGPGTKVRSLLKLFGQTIKDPSSVFDITDESGNPSLNNLIMSNPALRFVRGNLSPAISTGLDVLTGKDYIGDPTRDGMLSLSKRVVADNLTPIWMQSALLEGGTVTDRLSRGAAEFGGLRAYSLGKSDEEAVKEMLESQYGITEEDWERNKELYQAARDTLQPYNNIADGYWNEYPELEELNTLINSLEKTDPRTANRLKNTPEYHRILEIRAMIARDKKRMLARNPNIRRALSVVNR